MAAPIPMRSTNNQNSSSPAVVFENNDLTASQEFEMSLTTTSGGACSNLLIIPGPNPVFLATKLSTVEPTQVAQVLSSTASTGTTGGYAELKNVLAANSIRVRGIRMNSTDTNIYKGNLFYGEMSLTGFQKPVKVPLSKYATTIGGGGSYDSTLIIPNLNLLLTRNFYMYISDIPASLSKLTVAFIYDKDGNSSPLTDPK